MARRFIALSLASALACISSSAAGQSRPAPPPRPDAPPDVAAHNPPPPRPGSLITASPLGRGTVGMSLGGGIAVALPFYGLEAGVGVSDRIDIVGRFESVVGVLHYPRLGVRWNPFEIGSWRVGTALHANYSFFGIATDQVNLTSTFYLSADAMLSGPITAKSELALSVGGEVDVFEYQVLDGEGDVRGTGRYDATNLRLALRTPLTADLDGYVAGRLRIPVETFTYEATSFYVIPLIEIGGSWAF